MTFVLDESHWHCINAKVASLVFPLLYRYQSLPGNTLATPPPPQDRHLATVSPPPKRETIAR